MWTVELLAKKHRRESFDCGEPSLNDWLRTRATQWSKKGLSRVFVATHGDSDEVLGYYTLSSHHIQYDALPGEGSRGLPRINIPAILLGRLAVDRSVAGRGLGRYLLFGAMKSALLVSDHIGTAVFEVEAANDDARAFYKSCGLISLEDDPKHLFLPMGHIRSLDL